MVKKFLFYFVVIFLILFVKGEQVNFFLESREYAFNFWSSFTKNKNFAYPTCSATVVQHKNQTYVLTAGHCVKDKENYSFFIGRTKEDLIELEIIKFFYEEERLNLGDFAILKPVTNEEIKGAYLCKNLPESGEFTWIWEGSQGMSPLLRTGYIAGIINFPTSSSLQQKLGGLYLVDIRGYFGSSGSGFFKLENGNSCVWGVLSSLFYPDKNKNIILGIVAYPIKEEIFP